MIPTIEYIQDCFKRFNDLIFGSELPPIPIKLSKARSYLGKVEFKRRRTFFGRLSAPSDFLLRISTSFDLPESEWEDVIIHELIHYNLALKGVRDSSAHGPVFRSCMADINARFGRHITIRHKSAVGSVAATRTYIVCVTELAHGGLGVTVCAANSVEKMKRWLPRYFQVKSMAWYTSDDPFFGRYPRAHTPKIYKITREELDAHLER